MHCRVCLWKLTNPVETLLSVTAGLCLTCPHACYLLCGGKPGRVFTSSISLVFPNLFFCHVFLVWFSIFFLIYFASVHKYLFGWILFFAPPPRTRSLLEAYYKTKSNYRETTWSGVAARLQNEGNHEESSNYFEIITAEICRTRPPPLHRRRVSRKTPSVLRLLDCAALKGGFFYYYYFALWGFGSAT